MCVYTLKAPSYNVNISYNSLAIMAQSEIRTQKKWPKSAQKSNNYRKYLFIRGSCCYCFLSPFKNSKFTFTHNTQRSYASAPLGGAKAIVLTELRFYYIITNEILIMLYIFLHPLYIETVISLCIRIYEKIVQRVVGWKGVRWNV